MDKNVTNICRSAYTELWCISNIHHLLTLEATKTLVSAFIPSKLDYCKSTTVFWLPSIHSFHDTLQTTLSLSVSIATPLSQLPSHSLIQCSTRISTWTCTLCSLHSFSFHCHRKALNPPQLVCQWLNSRNLWPLHQVPHLFLSMQKCIDDLKTSMTVNKLSNKQQTQTSLW